MRNSRKYKVVSLFSGAMGLDLGLERTGRFELLACVEVEPAFCETIRANIKSGTLSDRVKVVEADISQLSVEEFLGRTGIDRNDVDLVIGGPPCQAFSTAGRRRTVSDPRGTLLWHYLRFIDGLRPKMFLMENVRGLLSAALKHRPIAERPENGGPPLHPDELPGSVVARFAADLGELDNPGYHLDCFEVNAVNYGAPQLRERALFIGNRFNVEVEFPSPTHGPVSNPIAEPDLFPSSLRPWNTLRDALRDLKDPGEEIMDFSPRKKRFLSLVPEGSNWRSLPEDIQKESMGRAWFAKGGRSGWWRRLTFDLPCPTLVTIPSHASTSLCHPSETRALTVKEYARIQEFPDAWEFRGTLSQKYAQIGNAVPVRLGEVAGTVISDTLDQLSDNNWQLRNGCKNGYRSVYIQAHVRTRNWYKNGEALVWSEEKEVSNIHYSAPKTVRRERVVRGV
ncbi:MAG: DNA cytosine methyltransferase [Oceanicaulis sp.]|uniref:DNA cytosine methyltransferase n=1 Tax=Glycocaulis sp. TaxID=1969725 RepID=UPI0025BA7DCD|nr:DNA cytosine methyltransferase [Glycocaulis sp.]MCC5980845.1 DNA cytosine methyltransferase [Oceanicaulis sp.]MCH8520568.1 DNA cytosine methyltransferase [Glycocaulis sp.]